MIEFKPRYFVLPAIAIAVLAMLHPASSGRAATAGRLRGADARPRHPRKLRAICRQSVADRHEDLRTR